jgi:hypothetical protein
MRLSDVANTKEVFRLIQSIPSKKAELFKQWLAKVEYERIQEIDNPELGQNRIKDFYDIFGIIGVIYSRAKDYNESILSIIYLFPMNFIWKINKYC